MSISLTHRSYAAGRLWHGCRLSIVCLSECKRCKIGPKLLLITNKKSHIGFQIACKSLTLDNLWYASCGLTVGHWSQRWYHRIGRRQLPIGF